MRLGLLASLPVCSLGETVAIGSESRDSEAESDYWPVPVLARLRVRVRLRWSRHGPAPSLSPTLMVSPARRFESDYWRVRDYWPGSESESGETIGLFGQGSPSPPARPSARLSGSPRVGLLASPPAGRDYWPVAGRRDY